MSNEKKDLISNLGVIITSNGAKFSIYNQDAHQLQLQIYKNQHDLDSFLIKNLTKEQNAQEDIYSVFIEGIEEGMAYEWYARKGQQWFGPLIDPYAINVKRVPNTTNSYRNIVTKLTPNLTRRSHIPWSDAVIYELHVGNFTKHPSSQVKNPGTFQAVIEKLPYLKELGITTIELLPVFLWNEHVLYNHDPRTGEVLKDVWGYNPISFFALMPRYVTSTEREDDLEEFKALVRAVHELDMEIILDVVYNHTGEGGYGGTIFNFKVLGDETYYRKKDGHYMNDSGTGNTLNTCKGIVKKLIIDSLKYWVDIMGVDGFRFDLASIIGQDENGRWKYPSLLNEIAEDETLSKVKLIAESWDAKGAYDVGKMPYPFVEWSDYFRDTIRKIIKGNDGEMINLAKCFLGKDITYMDKRRDVAANIHFVTAHDGFTMWDLVSFNSKHNERNGEEGRDGTNDNHSYNCGHEGETKNKQIIALRKRKIKNALLLLVLSKGVPMLVMGDEGGKTQQGNNNVYCQDNEIAWLDWERIEAFKELGGLVQEMIKVRKLTNNFSEKEGYQTTWHGVKYNKPDWSYYSRTLAAHISNGKEQYYLMINSYSEPLKFELPYVDGDWQVVIDTACNVKGKVVNVCYTLSPFTICLLKK